jgi:leucyl aminopeptidase (aminopeptidase T)
MLRHAVFKRLRGNVRGERARVSDGVKRRPDSWTNIPGDEFFTDPQHRLISTPE